MEESNLDVVEGSNLDVVEGCDMTVVVTVSIQSTMINIVQFLTDVCTVKQFLIHKSV